MALTQLAQYTKAAIIQDKAVNIEGGYVDDPNDSGGATNFGVTFNTANLYKDYLTSQFNWDGTMQNFSVAMAIYVYDQEYWQKLGLDGVFAVAPLVADKMFDMGINLGVPTAGPWLQRALNVENKQASLYADLKVDGNIGPTTCSALQTYLNTHTRTGMANLLWTLSSLQTVRYVTVAEAASKDETFEDGWENRARSQYEVYYNVLNS